MEITSIKITTDVMILLYMCFYLCYIRVRNLLPFKSKWELQFVGVDSKPFFFIPHFVKNWEALIFFWFSFNNARNEILYYTFLSEKLKVPTYNVMIPLFYKLNFYMGVVIRTWHMTVLRTHLPNWSNPNVWSVNQLSNQAEWNYFVTNCD